MGLTLPVHGLRNFRCAKGSHGHPCPSGLGFWRRHLLPPHYSPSPYCPWVALCHCRPACLLQRHLLSAPVEPQPQPGCALGQVPGAASPPPFLLCSPHAAVRSVSPLSHPETLVLHPPLSYPVLSLLGSALVCPLPYLLGSLLVYPLLFVRPPGLPPCPTQPPLPPAPLQVSPVLKPAWMSSAARL